MANATIAGRDYFLQTDATNDGLNLRDNLDKILINSNGIDNKFFLTI